MNKRILSMLKDEGKVLIRIVPSNGLLVSMAMRADHSFGMDKIEGSIIACGYTNEERLETLEEMRLIYKTVVSMCYTRNNLYPLLTKYYIESKEMAQLYDTHVVVDVNPSDLLINKMQEIVGYDSPITMKQLYEEISGEGFFCDKKEEWYARLVKET